MATKNYQHIYLYMDDSGKISKSEDCSVFAGIVFKNSSEKSEFINKYKVINASIKCKYCNQSNDSCDNNCIEIKGNLHLNTNYRRRIMLLSKKFLTFGTVIYNKNLRTEIISRAQSKGRFTEYAQRRIIKSTMKELIRTKCINPNEPIHLHVNIDQMPTKTNGYYTLSEGLREEFLYGIVNFDYSKQFPPIIFGELKIDVIYRDSKYDYGIQMADVIANTIHRAFVLNNNWYDSCEYLRNHLKINVILRLPN